MLKNYLKIAFRNLWKNKKLSFINLFGLAIGMACSLLIFLFVLDEMSYDRFHADADDIHRVVKDFVFNDDGTRIPDATTSPPLAPAIQEEIPEIIHVTRIHPHWGGQTLVSFGENRFNEALVWRADSSFFDVFTFPFIQGNPKSALRDVNSIVLTESTAKKYFGNEDPVGKVLNLNNNLEMMVTGVLKDLPANSHFHFDFLTSISIRPDQDLQNWNSYNYYTYIKVREGTDIPALNQKIQQVYERNQDTRNSFFYTQPVTDIHLTSHLKWELEPNGDKLYVYVFSLIGLFILLIAAINYINLSTARSSLRAKEIGVRKVSGAARGSLIKQFLLESVIICLMAAMLAIFLAYLSIPLVNDLTQKEISLADNTMVLLYMVLATLLLGIVAGIFPALYLSSFRAIAVLKGLRLNENGTLGLRKVLVVVQFTISIVLIVGVLVVTQQMSFIQSARLGFDKDQVLVVKNANRLTEPDRNVLLNSIKKIPGVDNAATAGNILGEMFNTGALSAKGSDKEIQLNYMSVNYDYLDVMSIEIKEGRGFSPDFPADVMRSRAAEGSLERTIGSIVVNEMAAKEFGLETGDQLRWPSNRDTTEYLDVIGVTEDFHFTSFRNEIKPFGFVMIPNGQSNFTVKLTTDHIQSTLSELEHLWVQVSPEQPFEYTFLDETFSKLYVAEARFQKLFIILVVLGIIIACLGLFGLATFTAESRMKEIGIRKVLGASVSSVVVLLSKDFLKLVLIALLIATPIAWYAMGKWLQDFAYRIDMEWWVFIAAAILAMAIAFLTISSQALKAALSNPVESMRSE